MRTRRANTKTLLCPECSIYIKTNTWMIIYYVLLAPYSSECSVLGLVVVDKDSGLLSKNSHAAFWQRQAWLSDDIWYVRLVFVWFLIHLRTCFSRHCGYIKAKQDPDEEKMQFQHGRGKKTHTKKHKKHKKTQKTRARMLDAQMFVAIRNGKGLFLSPCDAPKLIHIIKKVRWIRTL